MTGTMQVQVHMDTMIALPIVISAPIVDSANV